MAGGTAQARQGAISCDFEGGGAPAGDSLAVVVNAAAESTLGPDPVRRVGDAFPNAEVIAVDDPDELPAALAR